jgi:hypothetical protein
LSVWFFRKLNEFIGMVFFYQIVWIIGEHLQQMGMVVTQGHG